MTAATVITDIKAQIDALPLDDQVVALAMLTSRYDSSLTSEHNERTRAAMQPDSRLIATAAKKTLGTIEEMYSALDYKFDTVHAADAAIVAQRLQWDNLKFTNADAVEQLKEMVVRVDANRARLSDTVDVMQASMETLPSRDQRREVYQHFDAILANLPKTDDDKLLAELQVVAETIRQQRNSIQDALEKSIDNLQAQSVLGAFAVDAKSTNPFFSIEFDDFVAQVSPAYIAFSKLAPHPDYHSGYHNISVHRTDEKRDPAGQLQSRTFRFDENHTIGLPQIRVTETFKDGVRRKAETEQQHHKSGGTGRRRHDKVVEAWKTKHYFGPDGQLGRDDGHPDTVITHDKGKLYMHHAGNVLHCLHGPARHGIDREGQQVREYYVHGTQMDKAAFDALPEVQNARSMSQRLTRFFNMFTDRGATVAPESADLTAAERALMVASTLAAMPDDLRRGVIEKLGNAYPDYAGKEFERLRDDNLRIEAERNYAAVALQDAVAGIAHKQQEFLKIGAGYADAPAIQAVFQASADELAVLQKRYTAEINHANALPEHQAAREQTLDATIDKIHTVLGRGVPLTTDQMRAVIGRAVEQYAVLPNDAAEQRTAFIIATDKINTTVEAAAAKLGLRASELGDSLRTVGTFVGRDTEHAVLRPVADATPPRLTR